MSMTYMIEIVGEDKADILKLYDELSKLSFSSRLKNLTSGETIKEIVHGDVWK